MTDLSLRQGAEERPTFQNRAQAGPGTVGVPAPSGAAAGLVLASLALGGCAFLAGWLVTSGGGDLAASVDLSLDLDGDGLTGAAEAILGTDPNSADSDGDGFGDVEEIARGTNPGDLVDVPSIVNQSLGTVSYEQGSVLNYCSVMYVKAGAPSPTFALGVVIGGVVIPLDPEIYLGLSSYGVKPGKEPGDTVHVLCTGIPVALVNSLGGSLSMYSVVGPGPGSSDPPVAAAETFILSGGTAYLAQQAPGSVGGGLGVIYKPLTPASGLTGWQSGLVCFSSEELQGSVGPSLIYGVGSASCEPLDSLCDPDSCQGLAGSSVEIVDPLLLAGG